MPFAPQGRATLRLRYSRQGLRALATLSLAYATGCDFRASLTRQPNYPEYSSYTSSDHMTSTSPSTANPQLTPPAKPPSQRLRWFGGISLSLIVLIILPAQVAFLLNGKSTAEKILTMATQPITLSIVALGAIAYVACRAGRRDLALTVVGIMIPLWVFATDVVGGRLIRAWESQAPEVNWDSLPTYDYVVVLGGGTGKTPSGRAQLSGAGDRAATAARLYHRGLAKHLITTGDVLKIKKAFSSNYEDADRPTVQTREIWIDLGVPEERILSIGGENTSSEMGELAKHPEWWEGKRCAVITSAMHLPRAMRLASSKGIEIDGIPSDYRGKLKPLTVYEFMPQQEILFNLHSCFREWLGMRLGR